MRTAKKTYYKTKENKKVNNFIKKKTQNSVKSKYKEDIKKDIITNFIKIPKPDSKKLSGFGYV